VPTEPRRSPDKPLVARLTAAIEADILKGRLKPGERLEERALSHRYTVSRTPIREALRQLASTRLVEIRPRIGAVVARPTAGEIMELFELVAELEGVAAALAAERMDAAQRAAITEAHAACRRSAKGHEAEAYFRVNGQFHRAIHAAAGNLALAEEIEVLNKRIAPYRRFITFRPGRSQEALREHDAILRAIAERDPARARAAMSEHVRILGDDTMHLVKGLRIA
jgi:DNA-binding GntR family transcriptional regulator